MGRRYKGEVPEEMENDKGVPGKLYFEEPTVINLAVRRAGNNVTTIPMNDTVGPCRLASSLNLRDFNRKEPITYRMGLNPTIKEIEEYLQIADRMGFGNGAIVARRYCADWRYETPFEWGVILGCRRYTASDSDATFWAPFTLRWFNRTLGEEGAWFEDLFVIHQSVSKELLQSIIEDQENE